MRINNGRDPAIRKDVRRSGRRRVPFSLSEDPSCTAQESYPTHRMKNRTKVYRIFIKTLDNWNTGWYDKNALAR